MSRSPSLRVLVIMRSPGFLRNFENALRALVDGGHAVTVAIERPDPTDTYGPVRTALEADGVTFCAAPSRHEDARHRAAVQVRIALDYLEYLAPTYDDRPKLRARARGATFAALRPVVRRAARDGDSLGRIARQCLRALDRNAPRPAAIDTFLDAQGCDVLLVTPLVELGAPQTDWIRAARERGTPSVLGVASWDNLTVKGRIRESPDRVLVWNPAQCEEAVRLHGVAAGQVRAVGAHTYDHWFDWAPSRDRDAFCREVGLPAGSPFVLYLCSSPFIAPHEVDAVREWAADLRASDDAALRGLGILVRPHPQHAAQWAQADLSALGPVSVWPRGGGDPVSRRSRADFFDSMHHCAAVCGVNTSALIESTIVGRQVLTRLDARFADTQRGTLHFAHLADRETGILTVAETTPQHHEQLATAIAGDDAWQARRETFLLSFVRPDGLDVPAAPRFAAAVAATPPADPGPAQRRTPIDTLARGAWRLAPLRTAVALGAARRRALRDGLRRRPRYTVAVGRRGPRRREALADRAVEALAARARERP